MTRTPPPKFAPFDSTKPVRIYRGDLPHWRQEGATYFITFQTDDALPRAALDDLKRLRREWLVRNPPPHDTERLHHLNRAIGTRVEHWLHKGHGTCPFGHLEHRQRLYEALLFFHGTKDQTSNDNPAANSQTMANSTGSTGATGSTEPRVELGAFVIMPNHGHALVRPLPGIQLEEWAGSVKKFVSRRTPARFKPSGHLWQEETHDRIVRDLTHLNNCLHYIGKNPVLAGIPPEAANTLWINPDWQALGWSLGMWSKR